MTAAGSLREDMQAAGEKPRSGEALGEVSGDGSATRGRPVLASIEVVRIVASCALIAFHCQIPHDDLLIAGLIVFTAITTALSAQSASRSAAPMRTIAASRAQRLLVPWLVWSAVYAVIHMAMGMRHHQLFGWWQPWMPIVGTVLPLWYLPFAFVVSMAAAWLVRIGWRPPSPRGAAAWAAASAAVYVACVMVYIRLRQEDVPFTQWSFSGPAAALGVALAMCGGERPGKAARIGLVMLAMAAAIGGCWAFEHGAPHGGMGAPYVIGVAVLGIVWLIETPAGAGLLAVSKLSLGAYILHPLWIIVLQWLLVASKHPATLTETPAAAAVIVVMSFASAALLRLTPMRRFL